MSRSAEIHLHARLGDIQLNLLPATGAEALPQVQTTATGLLSRLSPGVDLALRISESGTDKKTGERSFDLAAAMEIRGRMTTAKGTAVVPGWVAWACTHVAREIVGSPAQHAY